MTFAKFPDAAGKAVPNRVAKAKAKLDFFLQYCSFATTVPNRVVKTKLNPPRRNT